MQEKLQNMKVSLTIRQTQCDYRVFATKKKKLIKDGIELIGHLIFAKMNWKELEADNKWS